MTASVAVEQFDGFFSVRFAVGVCLKPSFEIVCSGARERRNDFRWFVEVGVQ
jgi:hypothetical protein